MQQLDEERKQELIMAKQIRRDTVVIHGGTGNTTTRVCIGTLWSYMVVQGIQLQGYVQGHCGHTWWYREYNCKGMYRDTVVIHGGTGNTTTRVCIGALWSYRVGQGIQLQREV